MNDFDLFGEENADIDIQESDLEKELKRMQPWEKKYQGTDLDSIILPKPNDTLFRTAIQMKMFSNYILYSGSPGTGKTSLAKAIPSMLNTAALFLYGRRDADIIEQIEDFGNQSNGSIMPRFVIVDEVDKAKDPIRFYKSMQSIMDTYIDNLRFIFTCNDFYRIPSAVKSRCECVKFETPNVDDVEFKQRLFKRLMYISRTETAESGGSVDKNTVAKIMYAHFPDIRSMVGALRSTFLHNSGSIVGEPVTISNDVVQEFYKRIATFDAIGLLHFISTDIPCCNLVYTPLGNYLAERIPQSAIIPFGISLANAESRAETQVDQEHALWAFGLEVMSILKKYAPDWTWDGNV